MSLDFQQVQQQVHQMGENARERESQLLLKREVALDLMRNWSGRLDELKEKIEQIADDTLRCAAPLVEALDYSHPTPTLAAEATLVAADGSQIFPDRNAPVDFSLINVGTVILRQGTSSVPQIQRQCSLLYGDELAPAGYTLSETRLSLMRDFAERKKMADLAVDCEPPVITFTDGPLELFMSSNADKSDQSEFEKKRKEYMQVLVTLCKRQIITAGYVDKPGADLVIRMLEIASAPLDQLGDMRNFRPLQGVRDLHLFQLILQPGERSAVFALQSYGVKNYPPEIAPHFFYINVGRKENPWLARVEFPAWVASNTQTLDNLHYSIIHQCRVMGTRPYPYLLHRAHETAVVSMEEKNEVQQMIVSELIQRGIPVGFGSYKQAAKDLNSRTRYKS